MFNMVRLKKKLFSSFVNIHLISFKLIYLNFTWEITEIKLSQHKSI